MLLILEVKYVIPTETSNGSRVSLINQSNGSWVLYSMINLIINLQHLFSPRRLLKFGFVTN